MSQKFLSYLLPIAGILFITLEVRHIFRKFKSLQSIKKTKTSLLENISVTSVGKPFEFCAIPLSGQELAPISKQLCLHWSIVVVRLLQNEEMQSMPTVAMESKNKWIFFDVGNVVLPIRCNIDESAGTETFCFTSAMGRSAPPELTHFIDSEEFKSHSNRYENIFSIYPSHAVTFRESILANNQPYQVHGNLRNLTQEETAESQGILEELGQRKSLLPLTVDGENFHMSNFDEESMVGNIKKEIWIHIYLTIFAIAVGINLF